MTEGNYEVLRVGVRVDKEKLNLSEEEKSELTRKMNKRRGPGWQLYRIDMTDTVLFSQVQDDFFPDEEYNWIIVEYKRALPPTS